MNISDDAIFQLCTQPLRAMRSSGRRGSPNRDQLTGPHQAATLKAVCERPEHQTAAEATATSASPYRGSAEDF
ncbi:hypothetical protein ACQP2K_32060 [Microbispora siamensis]